MDLVGLGCRHSLIRYSKPGSSTIGIGSGDAGATAPTTIFASKGMNGDCAGIGRGDDLHRVSIGARHEDELTRPDYSSLMPIGYTLIAPLIESTYPESVHADRIPAYRGTRSDSRQSQSRLTGVLEPPGSRPPAVLKKETHRWT